MPALSQHRMSCQRVTPTLSVIQHVEGCDGFACVHPEYKSQIVRVLKNRGWLTGMNGDGVNDAPVLAVEGATDAAQGAAAIVLFLEPWHAHVPRRHDS